MYRSKSIFFLVLFTFVSTLLCGSFRITACSEVDPKDADIFEKIMKSGGYTLDKRFDDGEINTSSFNPSSNVDYIYNASHGSDYYICFAGSGGMSGSQFKGSNVKHLVTASCDTVSSKWKGHKGFSSSLKTVLGYHLVCYNDCAHHAAKEFGDAIVGLNPDSDVDKIVEAWKKANNGFDSHASKAWAACTANGYQSGSGNNSSDTNNNDWDDWNNDWFNDFDWACAGINSNRSLSENVGHNIYVSFIEGEQVQEFNTIRAAGVQERTGAYSQAERFTQTRAGGIRVQFRSGSSCTMSREQALEAAYEAAHSMGGVPNDAYPFIVSPVYFTANDGTRTVVNYLVCFKRIIDGYEISGRTGDCINILLSDEGIVSYTRLWREIEVGLGTRDGKSLLTPMQAASVAAPLIRGNLRSDAEINLSRYTFGYYSPAADKEGSMELQPCYHFYAKSGLCFHVCAETGALL